MERKQKEYIWTPGENDYQIYEECELPNGDMLQVIAMKHEEHPFYCGYITRSDKCVILEDQNYADVRESQNKERTRNGYHELYGSKMLVCTDPRRMKLAVIKAYEKDKTAAVLPDMKEVLGYGMCAK